MVSVPFALAVAEILFTLWVMNPALQRVTDTATATRLIRVATVVFFAAAVSSALTLVSTYILSERRAALDQRASDAAERADERAADAAKAIAADKAFAALSPADELATWMAFVSTGTAAPRQQVALAAIARRPNLEIEVGQRLALDNLNAEAQALTLVDQLPPEGASRLIEPFRTYGVRLATEIAAALLDQDPDARRDRLSYGRTRTTVFTAAARGLHRAGVDVRPELAAIREAVGTPDSDATRDIVRLCDYHLHDFSMAASSK